jgi:hypothetical protein
MNERIKELAEQAGFVDKGSNHTAYMSFDHEKFAELIVHECAKIADTAEPFLASDLIKQYFGVEE